MYLSLGIMAQNASIHNLRSERIVKGREMIIALWILATNWEASTCPADKSLSEYLDSGLRAKIKVSIAQDTG
jgi:hypothetical protein